MVRVISEISIKALKQRLQLFKDLSIGSTLVETFQKYLRVNHAMYLKFYVQIIVQI